MSQEQFWQAAAELIAAAGLPGYFKLQPLAGGANNRVFRVEVNGSYLLLKAYFQHPDDPRDRLRTEFAFSRFAWKYGVYCLPRPLACNPQHGLGLYEFVEGRRLLSHEVTKGVVEQALNFYRKLNCCKQLPGAEALPQASEACFLIADHLQCVERRLQNLLDVEKSSAIHREAIGFIRNELWEVWNRVVDSVYKRACALDFSLENAISQVDRCLSPSDFGFHNAILASDGCFRFIDFEYAGWDDPAKLVCDFFCQPAVPVSMDYYDLFVKTVVSELSEPEMHLQRIALLFPVYRIKWCCILLNDFLPVGRARRRFARGGANQEEWKARQLEKARWALQN